LPIVGILGSVCVNGVEPSGHWMRWIGKVFSLEVVVALNLGHFGGLGEIPFISNGEEISDMA
jgi:hypothetical protein